MTHTVQGDIHMLRQRGEACGEVFRVPRFLDTLQSMTVELPETVRLEVATLVVSGQIIVQHSWFTGTRLPFPPLVVRRMEFAEIKVCLRFSLDFALHDAAPTVLCIHLPSSLTKVVQDYLHPESDFRPALRCDFVTSDEFFPNVFWREITEYGAESHLAARLRWRSNCVDRGDEHTAVRHRGTHAASQSTFLSPRSSPLCALFCPAVRIRQFHGVQIKYGVSAPVDRPSVLASRLKNKISRLACFFFSVRFFDFFFTAKWVHPSRLLRRRARFRAWQRTASWFGRGLTDTRVQEGAKASL